MTQDNDRRESLAATFERHAEEESKILAQYRALAEKLGDSPPRFLIRLILNEEELHHQLLHATARWLREHSAADAAPAAPGPGAVDLVAYTDQLRDHEIQTIEACHRLRAHLSGMGGDLLAGVLDVMVMDSEKHHRLLTTVRRMLGG
jgi:hypothetical protein